MVLELVRVWPLPWMIVSPPPFAGLVARVSVPAPESVTSFARARNVLVPLPPFIEMAPALTIEVPFTVRATFPVMLRVLPLASCRLAMLGEMSRVTVLVPLVMQTFVEVLLGAPAGFQSPLVLHVPFPAMFQVEGLLSEHWAWTDAGT